MLKQMMCVCATAWIILTATGTAIGQTWDSNYSDQRIVDENSTATRFTFVMIHGWYTDAIRDNETGLVWQTFPSDDQLDWEQAMEYCVNARDGGRGGWRLPSVHELMTLMDRTRVGGPYLPAQMDDDHPVGAHEEQQAFYWTATRDRDIDRRTLMNHHSVPEWTWLQADWWEWRRVISAWTVSFASGQARVQTALSKIFQNSHDFELIRAENEFHNPGYAWCVRGPTAQELY